MCSGTNKKVAYINSARDHVEDLKITVEDLENGFSSLMEIWLTSELIDLRDYFDKKNLLEEKLKDFDIIRVRWWNTFVLRQAMYLSWLDKLILKRDKDNVSKVYAWFSAWVCVLSPTLKWLSIVDDPTLRPYWDIDTIREWLWILPYSIAPHYKSDHHESADVEKEVQFMIDNRILFIALRDWEVIIID